MLVEGAVWRMERQEELTAYFVSNLMNPHLKKPIQPQALIARLRGKSKEEAKKEQEYFKETFGLK